MFEKVFDNYEAFYNMVLSTTIMSNAGNQQFEKDQKEIIDFIGKAYNLDKKTIEFFQSIIIEKLSSLCLITEQEAIYTNRCFNEENVEENSLFDIKGDVLSILHHLNDDRNPNINPSWFNYNHYKTYQPQIRFFKINATSAIGNLIATRQIGLLWMIGIGCQKNYTEGIKRLKQCVLWGDIPAMHLLSYAYKLVDDEENAKLYDEVLQLSIKYLTSGYTVLPKEVKETFSEKACNYYTYISSIKQDIIYAYNLKNIDFSFLEAITSDTLDYFKRMDFINNYEKKEWKNVTNSTEKPNRKLGFK